MSSFDSNAPIGDIGSSRVADLYVRQGDNYMFRNVAFNPNFIPRNESASGGGGGKKDDMRLKDFLASIPAFSDFSEEQLETLESKASIKTYKNGEIIFKQGEVGDAFYVIHEGSIEILKQQDPYSLKKGDFGDTVGTKTKGDYFGERALMTSENRNATIKAANKASDANTLCLVFTKSVYEELISGSNALIGNDVDSVDWTKDHETRSLFKHIESVLEIDKKSTSPKIRRILYELSTAFTPELSVDEIISRMVMTVKSGLKADRVGLFVLSEDKRSMVLKVSERSKGIRLPVRGLAGAVINSNQALNVADAYQDSRFDSTMDRRSGYTTRQVLGVPVRHPVTQDPVGLLQVNNRTDGNLEPFSAEQQRILELAAEQLSELLHGREEAFIHSGVTSKSMGTNNIDGTSVMNTSEVTTPFVVEIGTLLLNSDMLEQISEEKITTIEVCVTLFLALTPLCESQRLGMEIPGSKERGSRTSLNLQFGKEVRFDIFLRDLPRATRIHFQIFGHKKKGKVGLGWAAACMFDFKGCIEQRVNLNLFSGENDVPINTTLSNIHDKSPSMLTGMLASDKPNVRLVHNMPYRKGDHEIQGEFSKDFFNEAHLEALERIRNLSFNPLCMNIITESDKEFILDIRKRIINRSDLLPAYIISVKWHNANVVQDLYDLLELWTPPNPVQALQLLDRRFMDPKVRAFAVHCLEELSDEELSLYMLQLCQQLKFENYIDSALARFLVRRSLHNKRLIGHIFFWLLQSEINNVDIRRRFSVLLQVYVRNCGEHRIELGHQMFVMKRLEKVAEDVCAGTSKEERSSILRKQLERTVLPTEFQLPLNPHMKVRGIEIDKCRVMESKKKPLWLHFKNAEGDGDCVLMLKTGDDLRQDTLTIQLLRVMNELWRREGLDMQMMLYDCISTGFEKGLLQIVMNAATLATTIKDATDKGSTNVKSGSLMRKLSTAFRAINDYDVLKNWIWDRVCEETKGSEESRRKVEMERRTRNFMVSTAAYCVASYVLGLGDRHNDNLMITKSAHFFHIDFGHILGNFKSKYGVKRERAPFVFTHAMKAVLSADQYVHFVELCCDAYNILRDNASLLVSLVSLAIPCQLPELQKEEDVMWLYEKLMIGRTDEEATLHFREQIEVSLNTSTTRYNDAVHMLAHA